MQIHPVALHDEIRYVLIGTGADPRALMPSSGRFVTPLPICCYFADISAQKSQKTTMISQSITSYTHVGCPRNCNFSIQDGQAAFSRKTRLPFVLSQKPSILSNLDLEDRQGSLKSSLIRS